MKTSGGVKVDYQEFLKSKIRLADVSGFKVTREYIQAINTGEKKLKPHEIDAIIWAAQGGRRALFEAFGLGKTCQQLALAILITGREEGKALQILPLGVKQEFHRVAFTVLSIARSYCLRRAFNRIKK